MLLISAFSLQAQAQYLACRAPQPPSPDLLCGALGPIGGPCACPNIGGQGPLAYGPGVIEPSAVQVDPQRTNYAYVGQQAQNLGIQCAQQSQLNLGAFVSCAQNQIVLPHTAQIFVDCAGQSGGSAQGFEICLGNYALNNFLNPEQQIAAKCVAETKGQPYAAAACTATRLTLRELQKCATDGIGGPNGCFGDNNDLVGGNGWTVRSFNNVVSDIQHGPGPTNDLVGPDGFVMRTVQNMRNDIQNGPGPNNDVVGCNGWVNRTIFGGGC